MMCSAVRMYHNCGALLFFYFPIRHPRQRRLLSYPRLEQQKNTKSEPVQLATSDALGHGMHKLLEFHLIDWTGTAPPLPPRWTDFFRATLPLRAERERERVCVVAEKCCVGIISFGAIEKQIACMMCCLAPFPFGFLAAVRTFCECCTRRPSNHSKQYLISLCVCKKYGLR